jgi:catechol 2,3-dioxygenase-like lactoylglutathione lyase family enzyme
VAGVSLSLENVNVITLFAEDLAGTKSFYEEVLGLQVLGEYEGSAVLKLGNVMVNLPHVSAAPQFGVPTRVAGPGAGAQSLLGIFVDDVDAACAELALHGVVLLDGPVDRPWGVRTASFTDPAGHVWGIPQDLT